MRFPSLSTIYVQYDTYLTYNFYRTTTNVLLGTFTRNNKHLYTLSFASGATATLVTTTPKISSDVWLALDCINSSDSGDSY